MTLGSCSMQPRSCNRVLFVIQHSGMGNVTTSQMVFLLSPTQYMNVPKMNILHLWLDDDISDSLACVYSSNTFTPSRSHPIWQLKVYMHGKSNINTNIVTFHPTALSVYTKGHTYTLTWHRCRHLIMEKWENAYEKW